MMRGVSAWMLVSWALATPHVGSAQDPGITQPFEIIEARVGDGVGTRILARNLSQFPVSIDSIHITRCLNVPRAQCASRALASVLPPDTTAVELTRIVPIDPGADFRFRASYSWHVDLPVTDSTTVLITPDGTLSLRQQLASPFALLGLSEKLGLVEDSLQLVGRGVWVYDIQVGNGETAEPGSRVELHHVGMFADGQIFTQTGRKPFTFTLGEGKVIDGWEDGVVGMRVGGRRQLVIPSELGYGAKGDGVVPPGAVLVFDVTLTGVGR